MPKTESWSKKDIPRVESHGRLAIVTGGTGGLGYFTALGLAESGATVILAARNEQKGKEALKNIKLLLPEAKVSFSKIDLASLESITEFVKDFMLKNETLDILVCNAGLMAPQKRETTADGLEIQFGTNHLGHFALTAQLLPALRKSVSPRVVNVSSIAARQGSINFEDIQSEKSYSPMGAYSQSKLANLLFTFELQKKSDEGNWGILSVSAHPGYSRTDILNGPGHASIQTRFQNTFLRPLFSQSAEEGALPILFAATSLEARKGGYYGPDGFYEMKGSVAPAKIPNAAKDIEVAKKLWDLSVKLTKVTWP